MKKYKYIVVVGCSFSASEPTLVKFDETYGYVIAEHFGAKCYNLSKMGGSLQRINRKTLEWCGKNTDKFKDTLIIVGMTTLNRIEIWNNKFCDKGYWPGPGWFNDPSYFQSPQSLLHKEPDRLTVPWSEEERKNYFINFYNDNAQIIIATNIIIGLQSFLTLNNIDHIFFDALPRNPPNTGWNNLVSQENWYKNSEYKSMIDFTEKNSDMRLSEKDFHPNKKAHKYWAECLIEYINEKI